MNPADLQPGDTVLARHSKPRGDALPLITETHAVVEKVYSKDRLVVGRVTRRFVYIEGSPTLGQAVPLHNVDEAFDFNDLVNVISTEGGKGPAEERASSPELTMELKLTVKYDLGRSSALAARAAMENCARYMQDNLLLTHGMPDARVEDVSFEIAEVPAQRSSERQRG